MKTEQIGNFPELIDDIFLLFWSSSTSINALRHYRFFKMEIIDEQMKNSILAKVGNAEKSSDKENICAAVNQLEALKNEINAQRGKKIAEAAADMLVDYANNLITQLLADLPAGEEC